MEITNNCVGADAFKLAMRRLPMPVSVVTVTTAEGPRGVTIGSFTSLSLSPPLVSFNLSKDSSLSVYFERSSFFVVNILSAAQSELSDLFAIPGMNSAQQFGSLQIDEWNNQPVLLNTAATIYCTTFQKMEVGDHLIIAGKVCATKIDKKLIPILYFDRSYHAIGDYLVK